MLRRPSQASISSRSAQSIVFKPRGLVCRIQCQSTYIPDKPKLSFVGVVRASSQSNEGMCPDASLFGEQMDPHLKPPTISKSDEQFADTDNLEFLYSQEGISLGELNTLFERVKFPRRDPVKLKIALENTHQLIWVRTMKSSRLAQAGQMVGFARATGDGVLSATIWDVAVSPAWQRIGLGRGLIERLTALLVGDGIPTITLYADPNVIGLYEKLGYTKDPEGIRGMAFQRKKKTGDTLRSTGVFSPVSA